MLHFSKLSAVAMAFTVAFAACTDGTGLADQPFAPEESAADLQAVQGAFAATVFESFALSSENFALIPDTGAVPVALLQASLAAASAGSRWESAAAAKAFRNAGPASGPLLPLDLHGRVYDRGVDGYEYNPDHPDRLDVPATGVRFILYEVDPITHEPGSTPIGYVDLVDESTELAYIAHVIVVTNDVVRIDYTVTAVVGSQTVDFAVLGFIGDGTDVVDVDLTMSFVEDGFVTVATVEYLVSVPTRNFEVDARVVFEFNSETMLGSMDITGSFMQGAHTVTVSAFIEFGEGDVPTEGGTVEIHVDGQLFAVVTITNDTVTVDDGAGGELTSAEVQAVRTIFDGLDELFDDKFEDFVRPVAWMFNK